MAWRHWQTRHDHVPRPIRAAENVSGCRHGVVPDKAHGDHGNHSDGAQKEQREAKGNIDVVV